MYTKSNLDKPLAGVHRNKVGNCDVDRNVPYILEGLLHRFGVELIVCHEYFRDSFHDCDCHVTAGVGCPCATKDQAVNF